MTSSERRLGPTPWGRGFAWIVAAAMVLGPLAVSERAFGLNEPASNQIVLLPIGLVLGVAVWRGLKPVLTGPAAVLGITAERLELTVPDQPVATVDRSQVGAVVVDGDDVYGGFTVVVHDNQSRVLHRWSAQWPGRRPASVVRTLTRAGWPAAVGAELYDGRFQAQVVGQPPVVRRPGVGGR